MKRIPVEINKTQPATAGDMRGGKGVVSEGLAAKMRHDRAHVGDKFGFHPQQRKLPAVCKIDLEGNMREAQEAGRVGRCREALNERRLDEINIRLGAIVICVQWLAAMGGLPLRHLSRRTLMVMAGAGTFGMRGAIVMMVVVIVMMVLAVHGLPQ